MIAIYPDKLELFLSDYPDYIPYPYTQYDQLKTYRRYYTEDNQIIKIIEIYDIFDTKYYSVKLNNSLQAVLPHPVTDIIYELVPLYNKNLSSINIINSDTWFTGAEIKYWFFLNRDSKIIQHFEKYIRYNSMSSLNDISLYRVLYNYDTKSGKIVSKEKE